MRAEPELKAWQTAQGQDLMVRLARIRALLERALGHDHGSYEQPAAGEIPAAAPILSALFNLSPFELDILLVCAGSEMDSRIAACCAEINGDARRTFPSFGLAMTAFPDAHWSALSPSSPLRYWSLVELTREGLLSRSPLQINERILHYLAGIPGLDQRLEGIIHPVPMPDENSPTKQGYLSAAYRAAQLLNSPEPRLLMLYDADRVVLREMAGAIASCCGLRLFAARASDIPTIPHDRHLMARLWQREALLTGGILLVETDGEPAALSNLSAFLDEGGFSVLLASEVSVPVRTGLPFVRMAAPRPTDREMHDAWHQALGEHRATLTEYIPTLTAQFSLPFALIRSAADDAFAGLTEGIQPDEIKRRLWDACRRQARPNMDDLAQRIETRHSWADIVLPDAQKDLLAEIAARVAQRKKVYETWGFGAQVRGTGTSVVFAGMSGTGKTLAAEILANELNLDLYRVDLSSVVSKYIGETEKNLRRIFNAAEYGGAILLFDEADALFGKRSEVRDSHDRYANIEVSFLLQQMETYRGLAILTTNMLENFDNAFLRRIAFIVQFPFPGAEERAQIWARMFPDEAPTEELDLAKLARLNITGGNIRNIALNGAFIAADDGRAIGMRHLLSAAVSEFSKIEKPLPGSEVGDWVVDDG